jgi:large subunit ribosomal protein L19
MSDLLLQAFDAPVNENLPRLRVGDSVTVYVRVNAGEKNERTQMIRGLIIRMGGGSNNESFTVRRIAPGGIGVELTFLARSPRIERIEVQRHAHVRRAKLYFMRERSGKSARLREKRYDQ